jgi:hypothetical protein
MSRTLSQSLTVENLMEVFGLSEAFSAPSLAKRCVLFALDKYEELCEAGGGPGIYPQVGSTGRREGVTRAYQERWGGGDVPLCARQTGGGVPLVHTHSHG